MLYLDPDTGIVDHERGMGQMGPLKKITKIQIQLKRHAHYESIDAQIEYAHTKKLGLTNSSA